MVSVGPDGLHAPYGLIKSSRVGPSLRQRTDGPLQTPRRADLNAKIRPP
jgi:hypothetical protein